MKYAVNALYGPNIDNLLSYKESVFESDNNIGVDYILYTGDWNVSFNPALENKNFFHKNNHKTLIVIKERMVTDHLVNVWRSNNWHEKCYTWS